MTEILLSTTPVAVEATYGVTGLSVGLIVSKWNGTVWVPQGAPVAVPSTGTGTGTYAAVWTPPDESLYCVELAVFTDGTLTVIDSDYGVSSRTFQIDPTIASLGTAIATLNGLLSTIALNINPRPIGGKISTVNLIGFVSTEETIC